MNFFAIIKGVCTNPDVFLTLVNNTLKKAVWHLILLCFLLSCFVVGVKAPQIITQTENLFTTLKENCGKIEYSNKIIIPTKNPESDKYFVINFMMPFAVSYLPSIKPNVTNEAMFNPNKMPHGIIWTPELIVAWSRAEDGLYSVFYPTNVGRNLTTNTREAQNPGGNAMTADALLEHLRAQDKLDQATATAQDSRIQFDLDFNTQTLIFLLSSAVVGIGIKFFIITGFYILIFVIIFSLMGGARLRNISKKQLLVLAIYGGFPAMIVGSFFPAFQLPVLEYNSVYLFGMTGYMMFILARFNPKPQAPPEKDDFDF